VPDPVRLLAVQDSPLDVAEMYAAVQDRSAGGVALFVGAVRDHDGGQAVSFLEYTAHPSADAVMRSVADDIVDRFGVTALAAAHRLGRLEVGDIAVVTAVACAHRGDAFEACRAFIDEVKNRVPIWKHQLFSDGAEEWVGTP
jgi:molybdopterin synthase catalytic subunit